MAKGKKSNGGEGTNFIEMKIRRNVFFRKRRKRNYRMLHNGQPGKVLCLLSNSEVESVLTLKKETM